MVPDPGLIPNLTDQTRTHLLPLSSCLPLRFLLQPRSTIESTHSKLATDISDEITNLKKKVRVLSSCRAWFRPNFSLTTCRVFLRFHVFQEKYLQKQFDDANGQLRDIVSPVVFLLASRPARHLPPRALINANALMPR